MPPRPKKDTMDANQPLSALCIPSAFSPSLSVVASTQNTVDISALSVAGPNCALRNP